MGYGNTVRKKPCNRLDWDIREVLNCRLIVCQNVFRLGLMPRVGINYMNSLPKALAKAMSKATAKDIAKAIAIAIHKTTCKTTCQYITVFRNGVPKIELF